MFIGLDIACCSAADSGAFPTSRGGPGYADRGASSRGRSPLAAGVAPAYRGGGRRRTGIDGGRAAAEPGAVGPGSTAAVVAAALVRPAGGGGLSVPAPGPAAGVPGGASRR